MVFEVLSILALFAVLVMATYTMVGIMEFLAPRMKFIPAAWLTTAWGVTLVISSAAFLLHLVRLVCGV